MFRGCEVIIFVCLMLKLPYFLASGVTLLLGWTAVALGLNMNITWTIHQSGGPLYDDFFIHFSWLAEWALIFLSVTIALIVDWKRALFMGGILGIQALIVAAIKQGLNAPRPIEINHHWVRLIPHLQIHHWQAFPSGHTAVAFFTMGWLSLNYPKSYKHSWAVGLFLFIVAAGIGYSRMYLGQHSLIDVCAGASIALIFLFIAQYLGNKWRIHE